MAITLTDDQINQIRALRDAGPIDGNYSHIYTFISGLLPEGDEKNWFLGAAEANAGQGAFSALIRAYSQRQMELRGLGELYTPELMQDASNEVAKRALIDILNPERRQADGTRTFPTINDIATNDASGVGATLFATLPTNDSALTLNSGWSGTVLFSALNSDQTWRLMDGAGGAGMNRLEDVKNVLFAYDALAAGISAAYEQSDITAMQFWTDTWIGVQTWEDSSASLLWSLAWENLTSILPPSAQPLGELIENAGTQVVLNWIESALNGPAASSGSTDFVSQAAALFGVGGEVSLAEQQAWQIQVLPNDRDAIVQLAKNDEAVRNALVSLSPIAISMPSYSADVSLYNETTCTGELTEEWLIDRANFLTWDRMYQEDGQTDGVFEVSSLSGDSLYIDMTSQHNLLVDGFDFNVIPTNNIVFGSNNSENLLGGEGEDRLYGGGGNDEMIGAGGNDHLEGQGGNDTLHGNDGDDELFGGSGTDTLEGGIGDDRLEGGQGNDTLRGGDDNDTLEGGCGADRMEGGAGFDTYHVKGNDTIFDSDGQGQILYNGTVLNGGIGNESNPGVYVGGDGTVYNLQSSTLLTIQTTDGSIVKVISSQPHQTPPTSNHQTPSQIAIQFDLGITLNIPQPTGSPIVLDLDGNGVATIGVQEGTHFDLNGDGAAEQIGWVNGQDGLLVRDLDGNGRIDNGGELFGSETILANGEKAPNGYIALAELDSNGDGQIDRLDTAYSDIKIWRDSNGDACSSSEELFSLADAGIASIATGYSETNQVDANGNSVQQVSTFTKTDGTTGTSVDVWFQIDQSNAIQATDPLVLDLNGDGVQLQQLGQSSAYFDLDADGIANHVGWVSPEDGLLALDKNQDGEVNDIGELFGSQSSTGFDALSQYDLNHDNVIDQQDAVYSDLKVWRDGNSDGLTQTGELLGLADYEISSISLSSQPYSNGTPTPATHITDAATFTRADGQTSTIANVMVERDPLLTRNNLDIPVSEQAMVLPELKGYGNLRDLQVAASLDLQLATDIQALLATPSTDYRALTEAVMYQWAGVDGIDPNSRGGAFDARKLAVLEAFRGESFASTLGSNPTRPAAVQALTQAWQLLVEHYASRIAVESGALTDYLPGATYNVATDDIVLNDSVFNIGSRIVADFDPIANPGNPFVDLVAMVARNSADGGDLYFLNAQDPNVTGVATSNAFIVAGDEGNSISLAAGNIEVYGGGGNNSVSAIGTGTKFVQTGDGNDQVSLGEGSASVFVGGGTNYVGTGNGSHIIVAGAGDDYVSIGSGSAVVNVGDGNNSVYAAVGDYIVSTGIGNDNITVGNGNSTINVGQGSNSVYVGNGTATVTAGDGGNSVNAGTGTYQISTGAGMDGITIEGGSGNVITGAGNDSISIVAGDLYVDAGEGNDYVSIGSGSAVMNVGDGNNNVYAGAGNYLVDAGIGDDSVNVGDGNSTINVGQGSNNVYVGNGTATVTAGDGGNSVNAGTGTYQISMGAGMDGITIEGGTGSVSTGAGNDSISISGGDFNIDAGQGANNVYLGNGNSTVTAGDGGNSITAGTGTFHITTGAGLDNIAINSGAATVNAGDGDNYIGAGDGDFSVSTGGGHDSIQVGNGNSQINAGNGNNTIYVGAGNFEIISGSGNDVVNVLTVDPSAATKYIETGGGSDQIATSNASDTVAAGSGDDEVYTYGGNDVLDGGAGNDTLDGGTGNDVYVFGHGYGSDLAREWDSTAGNTDTVRFNADVLPSEVTLWRDSANLYVTLQGSSDTLTFENHFASPEARVERIEFSDGTVWNAAVINSAKFLGTEADDSIYGTTGNDTIEGVWGNDNLSGDAGNDSINGGRGNDTLDGGSGNDSYVFARGDGRDDIYDAAGTDAVRFAAGIAPADVDVWRDGSTLYLDLIGTSDRIAIQGWYDATTNRVENVVFADGTTWGASVLAVAKFKGTDGADSLSGTTAADTIVGLGGNDYLYADSGNDTLDGGVGNDTLDGGLGNDVYLFGRGYGQDVITESSGSADTIRFLSDVVPGDVVVSRDASNLYLTIVGSNDRITVQNHYTDASYRIDRIEFADGTVWDSTTLAAKFSTASEGDDFLWGTTANNAIDGLGGNDQIIGNEGDDTLTGGAGNDYLDGGVGTDTLVGGTGDDTYVVDATTDVITEAVNEGIDTVQSTLTYTLGSTVENLVLIGTAAINATGNTSNNVIVGNIANNTLNGGSGADSMSGGAGDDTYVVDVSEDVIFENAGEGTDLVQSTVTYALASNVENLTLTGTAAINGTGNDLNNVLTGNSANNTLVGGAGNDTLNGGTGSDTMFGGSGNDTYVVNIATDIVTENANEGTDTVQSSITYTAGANIENVTLTGSAVTNATGNDLNNVLTGNSANNTLTGGAGDDTLNGGTGSDTMIGGTGNDTYVVNVSTDVVTENASEGTDTVQSSIAYVLGSNLENITLTGSTAINATGNDSNNVLTGNSANNVLTGAAGDDTLNGGAGSDTMIGGSGDDTYVVNVLTDVVTENANEGTDTVQSSITYTAGANVENVLLTGSTAINATGNDLNNVLTGNSANNTLTAGVGDDTLNGGSGSDTMIGGTGNDMYVVNVSTDVVTENANEGTDTVQSSVTYTLAANVENLSLTGTAAINGTGNSLSNTLEGNSANNTLTGGAGNDTYQFGRGSGSDKVSDNDSTVGNTDALQFGADINIDQLWFVRNGDNLEISIIGSSDKMTIQSWYSGAAYHTEQFRTANGQLLLDSQVDNLVNAMAAFAPPSAGQSALPTDYQSALAPVIAANWQAA